MLANATTTWLSGSKKFLSAIPSVFDWWHLKNRLIVRVKFHFHFRAFSLVYKCITNRLRFLPAQCALKFNAKEVERRLSRELIVCVFTVTTVAGTTLPVLAAFIGPRTGGGRSAGSAAALSSGKKTVRLRAKGVASEEDEALFSSSLVSSCSLLFASLLPLRAASGSGLAIDDWRHPRC